MNIILNKPTLKKISILYTHGDYANIATSIKENTNSLRIQVKRAITTGKGDVEVITSIIKYYKIKQRKSKIKLTSRAKSSTPKKTKHTGTAIGKPAAPKMGSIRPTKRPTKNKTI